MRENLESEVPTHCNTLSTLEHNTLPTLVLIEQMADALLFC
jgi:hypothetical protein